MYAYINALPMATAMHACAAANLNSQRTAGTKIPREGGGAQRPLATLNYYYTTVGPKEHQGHRRTCGGIKSKEGHQRDRRAHGGTRADRM